MAAINEVQETAATGLGALLDAGDGAFVTLVAGETQLAAHRAVLAARSPVFAAMFAHDTLEARSGRVVIPDVEGPVLRELLAHCYSPQAPPPPCMAPQLLAAADKYGLAALRAVCEQQVAAQLAVENAAAAAVLAVRHSCPDLTAAAVAFIKAQTHQVMATQGWEDAVRNQPEDLIKVSRLVVEPSSDTSAAAAGGSRPAAAAAPRQPHSQTSAAAPRQPHSQTSAAAAPPPDEAAVSRLWSLSAGEKGRRLVEAAKQGAVGQLRALLAAGADVGAEDGVRRTALHWAAREGHVEAASCLVGGGAAVDARDRGQWTPLHLAALCGRAAVVRLLLQSGADANARERDGWTPLHHAAANAHAEAAAALLQAGADRGARDNNGRTALDLARKYNKQQLVAMLQ